MLTFEQGKQLVKDMFVLGSYQDFPTSKIIEVLQSADDLYYNDELSFLEDNQYDALRMYAERLAPADVYFTGIGSDIRGGKVKLPFPMGSLDQIFQGDFDKWVEKHNLEKEMVLITDKLDGLSCLIVYDNNGDLQIAYSRGDGVEGADITRHVKKIPSVPTNVGKAMVVRGEIIIPLKNWDKVKQTVKTKGTNEYKNPRNCVSGLINSSEKPNAVYNYIDVVAYEVVNSRDGKNRQLVLLKSSGFKIPFCRAQYTNQLNDTILTTDLNDRRAASEYEIDGVVIDVNDTKTRERLTPSRNTLNPAYAVKYKVADATNYAEVEVVDVEWNISKDGYFKPRVKIEPTELVGVTIQYATGFNAKFIAENGIGPGAIIRITRSGDVIPFILGVVKPSPMGAQMPNDKNVYWTSTGVDLVLNDAHEHDTVKFEQLKDFFTSLDVPNLGEGNLKPMFDAGFKTPESIIELTQQDIGNLIGSMVNGKKIFTGIREKLTDIPIYILMGSHPALGRGIGKRKCKKLWEAFHGDISKCTSIPDIIAVEGFDQKTAAKVAGGYDAFVDFYDKIKEYVKLKKYEETSQTGNMSGQTVVFTGFRDKSLEQKIETVGGKIGSSVSGKTTLLVSSDPDSNSGKTQKARDLGIKIISVDELKSMVN